MTLRARLAQWLLTGTDYTVTTTEAIAQLAQSSYHTGVSVGQAMEKLTKL